MIKYHYEDDPHNPDNETVPVPNCPRCGEPNMEQEATHYAICIDCQKERHAVLDAMTDEVVANGLEDRIVNLERE